ncbi:MAG: DNA-directed RNA polymerase subunit RpoH/Rpb5 C-terminal domain-containing protein [Candidatus Micrarchaeia archaeon]
MNSEHYLVPPHRILSEKEAERVLAELKIPASKLPKIFVTDPQAKKLGAKVGQIIEIDRGEDGKYYRLVVPAQ